MDSRKKLRVAFLWHMHQPFYKDYLSGSYQMPWVRLHGVKDYFPMAALIEQFDTVRVCFNLVPVLIEQINDYVHNNATDILLDLTVKRAASLTLPDRVQVLDNFFKVNFKQFVEPSPRYAELLTKKGLKEVTGYELERVVKRFSSKDLLDLQVLFNLSWFHSITIDEDVNLKDIVAKGKGYTEQDKEYVVMRQKEVLAQIVPLYRRLQESGRIEITATPYYHPILPLVCDTASARMSMPAVKLPKRRFAHPEDAAWHIEEAIRYHTEQFGQPPRGMWPSEGSVSEEVFDIMISKGIDWVATDEDILFNTLSKYDKRYKEMGAIDRRLIYQPYRFKRDSRHLNVIFRDKNLSDMISFNYNSWDPRAAAEDLITHCRRVAESLRRDPDVGLLTIAMDGENAWEYYADNGRAFFETLYANLDRESDVGSTTVSDYLRNEPPKKTLKNIFTGSWINHNFDIWIGQEQDNLSWDYLDQVRKDLVKFTRQYARSDTPGVDVQKAWRELYVAEGSDWNWWYGGKARAGGNNPFDKLYRTHLKNVYRFMKKPVPDFLKISIA